MSFAITFPWDEKMQQNTLYGENIKNGYSYFSHSMSVFSHSIPILWYTSLYGKCMGLLINFPQHGKMEQNLLYRKKLGNWYSYFSHSMGAFFSLGSHPMVYFIIWEIYVFSHRFPAPIISPSCGILHHTGNALVSPSISRSTEITNTFSIAWALFSHQIHIPMVYFITWEMNEFLH